MVHFARNLVLSIAFVESSGNISLVLQPTKKNSILIPPSIKTVLRYYVLNPPLATPAMAVIPKDLECNFYHSTKVIDDGR